MVELLGDRWGLAGTLKLFPLMDVATAIRIFSLGCAAWPSHASCSWASQEQSLVPWMRPLRASAAERFQTPCVARSGGGGSSCGCWVVVAARPRQEQLRWGLSLWGRLGWGQHACSRFITSMHVAEGGST